MGNAQEPELKVFNCHWMKSNDFKTVHVDGAFGGLSPHGETMNMSVYSERWPIPILTSHPIDPEDQVDMSIGKTVSRVQRDGIVREVSVNLVFSIKTAEAIVAWLSDCVEKAKNLSSAIESEKQ